jgi:hypothetical protein
MLKYKVNISKKERGEDIDTLTSGESSYFFGSCFLCFVFI